MESQGREKSNEIKKEKNIFKQLGAEKNNRGLYL